MVCRTAINSLHRHVEQPKGDNVLVLQEKKPHEIVREEEDKGHFVELKFDDPPPRRRR